MPLTVSVKPGEPAKSVVGEMFKIVGLPVTLNVKLPVEGAVALVTATMNDPTEATSDASTVAVSFVALTQVVGSAARFHDTTESLWKLAPTRVIVNVGLPAKHEVGLMLDSTGPLVIVKVLPFDAIPVVVATVTVAVPAAAISVDGTCAVSWVDETNVVASPAPFHFAP